MRLHIEYISTDYELKWSRSSPPTSSRQIPVYSYRVDGGEAVPSIMERLYNALWRRDINTTAV
jgi:hypothetical protein